MFSHWSRGGLFWWFFGSHGGSSYIGGGSFKSAEALLGSLEALSAELKAYSGAVEGHRGSVELVLVLDPWDAIFLHCGHRAVICRDTLTEWYPAVL
jgi:hypothetical protein